MSLFQNSSNVPESSLTIGPAAKTSSSATWDSGSTWKYSSPMLRPPISATALSTTISLLCIR